MCLPEQEASSQRQVPVLHSFSPKCQHTTKNFTSGQHCAGHPGITFSDPFSENQKSTKERCLPSQHSPAKSLSHVCQSLSKPDYTNHVSEAVQVRINSYYTNGVLERGSFKYLGAVTIPESDGAVGTNLMSVFVSVHIFS